MNPDAPRTPREELEIKITALLMGQLPPEEAAEVEAQIAADPELAALHARLRHAAHLLRESRTLPEPAASATPLQLSKERREKLLATFRGIKPPPFPLSRPVPVPKVVQTHRKDRKWVAPIALAASIAVLIGSGIVFFSGDSPYAAKYSLPSAPEAAGNARSEREHYGFVDLNQPSLGEQPQDYSIQTLSHAPPSSSTSSRPISGDQDSLAANSQNRWRSQPGAIRDKLYSSIDEFAAPANRPDKPVLGSGQVVPEVMRTPGSMSGGMGGGGGRASGGGVYLPSIDANGGDTSQTPTRGLAGAKAADPRERDAAPIRAEGLSINGAASASGPVGASGPTAKSDVDAKLAKQIATAMPADDVGLVTKGIEDQAALGEKLVVSDGAVDQYAVEEKLSKLRAASEKGDASQPKLPEAGRPLAANPITAGNRSGSLATNSNAIDALLFGTEGIAEINKSSGTARGDGLKDAPSDGKDVEGIKQLAQDAENNVQLGRYYKAPQDAARSSAVWDVQSQWGRPYRRFDEKAAEVRGGNKPDDAQGNTESALTKLNDQQPTQGVYQRAPSTRSFATNGVAIAQESVNTAGENTFWDSPSADRMARSKSRETVGRELKEDTKAEKAGDELAALNLGGFAGAPAVTSGGAAGAPGDFDRGISKQTEGPYINKPDEGNTRFINLPDGTRSYAPLTPPPVVTGTGMLADDSLAYFAAPQIPQTFGNTPGGAGIVVPATPTTPEKPNTELGLEPLQIVDSYAVSTPLRTAGKVQLDGGVLAPFAPPTQPEQASPDANSPAGQAVASKPAATPAPGAAPAQEKFVSAFITVRKAEEKAAAGDAQNAQKLYREAADDFAKIKQQWPEWQPELLEYRLKRTEETLGQLEAKVDPTAAEALLPPAGEPPAPVKAPEPAPVPQPEVSTKENAFSTFSLNVSDVSFQLAGASLEKGAMPEPATVRSEEFINALNYRDPEPVAGAPFAFASERARYPFAHNRDLLRLSVKTAAAGREPGKPLNLVLLLDNSGSMERADRVRILKESLRVLTQQLQPQDKLSLITFSRTPRLWADGVSGEKAVEITQRVGEITPQGGTDLSAAMDLGYKTALKHYQVSSVNRVVLLTDGAANLGDVKAEALKAKVEAHRKQGVAFDCFGVGWEGYNDDLLEQLSRNGDGRYGFINTPEAAATEFAGQLAGALRVAASDVKVQVEFNPRRVLAYRQVGYAKHQLKKEQFRDNTVDAAEIGAAESGNALYVIEVNPRGEGDIATVRVRFKVPGTSDYQEHDWTVPFQAPAPAMEQSSSSLRLAATAAAFSEWLVQSPFATEVTSDRLLGMINGIPAIYGADRRPAKLESMIRQAKSISGR